MNIYDKYKSSYRMYIFKKSYLQLNKSESNKYSEKENGQ